MPRLSAAGLAIGLMMVAAAPAPGGLPQTGAAPPTDARPILLAQAATAPPNVEANIAQLHQRLQITPAQEPQFAALANVMRQNERSAPAGPPANPNAVEALRLAIQYGQHEIDDMKRLLPVLQALYASLSPAQQRAADMVFRQGPGE